MSMVWSSPASLPVPLQRALRRATQPLRRWGGPALLGALAWLVVLAAWAAWLPWQGEQLDAARDALRAARLAALRHERTLQAQAAPRDATPPAERFLAAFPPAAARETRVATLWALAQVHALEARRSEFAQEAVTDLPLQRYRLALPVNGSYTALRRFIAEALATDPALSLDGLRLERTDPTQATLQAQMQWSFWMQSK